MKIIKISTDCRKIFLKEIIKLGTADHPLAILGSGVEYTLNIESDRAIAPMTVYLFRNGSINPRSDAASAVRIRSY